MTELRWAESSFASFADDILHDRFFSFARYGDGEWSWVCDRPTRNRCGHRTFAEASAELREAILSRPGYRLGNMGVLANWAGRSREHRDRWGWAWDWIRANGLGDIDWHNNLLWVNQSARDSFARQRFALFDVLRDKRVVLVGPDYLTALPMPLARHIVVRRPNCWLDIDRVQEAIELDFYDESLGRPTVYALSCSLVANLLVHRLWPTVGQGAFLIDFGSVWEPYVGRAIRRYHNDILTRGAVCD